MDAAASSALNNAVSRPRRRGQFFLVPASWLSPIAVLAFGLVLEMPAQALAASCVAASRGNVSLSSACAGPLLLDGSSHLTITGSGAVNGGSQNGVVKPSDGGRATLTNGGAITSSLDGVLNNTGGAITTLTNNGSISGGAAAIENGGTISVLNNNDSISSGLSGIGIYNHGGTLNGNATLGTIVTINNTGTISGSNAAIENNNAGGAGTIGKITNSGIISGTEFGILNQSTGNIGPISNSGTISGLNAIQNGSLPIPGGTYGKIGTITNSGVIAGNIVNTSANTLTINGGSGTVFGTLTGQASGTTGLINNPNSNVVFGTGNLVLNDNITVGTTGLRNAANLLINNGSTPIIVTGKLRNTGSLSVTNGATLDVSQAVSNGGAVSVTNATLNAATYTQTGGRTIINNGTLDPTSIEIENGLFTADHATLDGPLSLRGGTLEIGASGATATGLYAQSGGSLEFDASDTGGSFSYGALDDTAGFKIKDGDLEFDLSGATNSASLKSFDQSLFATGSSEAADLASLLSGGTVSGRFSELLVFADIGGKLDTSTIDVNAAGVVTGETISPVPVPAALPMFGAVIIALTALGARKPRRASMG